jgi:hypothetical protein
VLLPLDVVLQVTLWYDVLYLQNAFVAAAVPMPCCSSSSGASLHYRNAAVVVTEELVHIEHEPMRMCSVTVNICMPMSALAHTP